MVQTIEDRRNEELDPVPDAHAFVVVRRGVRGRNHETDDSFHYEVGDEYPDERDGTDEVHITSWNNWGVAKLVPVDEVGEILEGYRPPASVRRDEDTNVEAALSTYRRRHGIRIQHVRETSYVCQECGAEFEGENARDRLNGHMQVHRRKEATDGAEGSDDGDGMDGSPDADDGADGAAGGPSTATGDELLGAGAGGDSAEEQGGED